MTDPKPHIHDENCTHGAPDPAPRPPLTPAAERALAEAAARRAAADAARRPLPRELQGPKGPEPTRYGDWDVKGIASDF